MGSAFSKVMIQMQLAVEKGTGAFTELEETANAAGYTIGDVGNAVGKGGKTLKSMAEALGTNSSSLKKWYKEADKSKSSLENFSNVAGVTSEEFSKMFKSNPSEAIMKFVEGLSHAEEKGTSAIKVLDDMDIKEVRLRDSLLRAAGASGTFGDAITMGNKAFKENTALTAEANKRYETTESKLKMLKNEAKNAAIDLGGPFVDALRDGMESAKPLIKSLGDLAKKFSDADPKTQQMIIKLGAFAMAAGPVLSITGKLTSGIGGLGKSFVEMSAQMAQKKAIAEVSKQLVEGSVSVDTLSTALGGGVKKLGLFGGAASSAAGSGGLGAMAATLGPLGPAILGIVGVGGALAVGYGAWKLFGEEAWNSSQRVERWGSDVGEVTEKTLTKIQDDTQAATGQFGLMEEGLSGNTAGMVESFEKVGATIEQSLIKKIEGLDKLIRELPEGIDSALGEMLENEKVQAEGALEVIQANSERITDIKRQASNEGREINASEAKIIKSLNQDTLQNYVDTLDLTVEEKKKVLSAMTGDVANASEKEASLWLQSLGKQRAAAEENMMKSRKEKEKYLEDLGYNLDGEFAQKFLKAWDEINKTTVDGFDQQMATITEKYPELLNKVYLGNGQLISGSDEMAQFMIQDNKDIVQSAQSMADELAENAQNVAEAQAWTVDEFGNMKTAAEIWNKLELKDKEGNIKSNAAEIVTEGTKDITKWNQMRMVLHDANLDSNAKLVIGEAAIANGRWDGMAWEDKQAVLQDEFSQNTFKALRAGGKWDEMTFEEKKAILYSNTPEKMAETMLNLGLWEEYEPTIKELEADNYEFLNSLYESEEKMKAWNELPSDTRYLLVDNQDVLDKIFTSEKNFARWNSLPEIEKRMLADNTDVLEKVTNSDLELERWNSQDAESKKLVINNEELYEKVFESTESLARWNFLSVEDKQLAANNQDLLSKLLSSGKELDWWNGKTLLEKTIAANNEDLNNKIYESAESLAAWKNLPVEIKKMLADNVDIMSKVKDGTMSVEEYNAIEADLKVLNGDATNVKTESHSGIEAIDEFTGKNIDTKLFNGDSTDVKNESNSGIKAIDNFTGKNVPVKKLNGDSSSVKKAASSGESSLSSYNRNNPAGKRLEGTSFGVSSAAKLGGLALDIYSRNNPGNKTLNAVDNASGPAWNASEAVGNFDSKPSVITKTLSVVADIGSGIGKLLGLEKGTSFHIGGPAIVNDQKGPTYKELVIPKGGVPFVPEGRDVFLPDLPKGSKVIKASLTKRLIPRYADGVGIPQNAQIIKQMQTFSNSSTSSQNLNINVDQTELISVIQSQHTDMMSVLKMILQKNPNIELDGTILNKMQDSLFGSKLSRLMYGKG
ncbi:phage tail tape measure protein, TP901 family, core region [Enterococcus phoeniculicola]|nr:phage tail tape measure protein, TP901 family, core region [Enterococcus phoeniculicola]